MLSVQAGMNIRNSIEHVTASTHTEVVGRKRTATLLSTTFNPDVPKDMYGFLLELKDTSKYDQFIDKHLQDLMIQQEKLEDFKRDGGMSVFNQDLLLPYAENISTDRNMISEEDNKKLLQLGSILRGGIPANMRAEMWRCLSGINKKPIHRGIYQSLLENSPSQRMSTVIEQIDKDLPRTFPGFTFTPTGYEFQPALRRVLRAYAARNPSVGYCQSMNFVAGGLLVFLEEEEAFWVLCWLVENVLHGYFSRTMIGLQVDSKLFEKLLKENLPALSAHLQKIGLHYILFTAQWFLCLFLNNMTSEASFRVWDALFFYGTKVLHETAVNVFKLYQKELMAIKEQTELVSFLNKRLAEMFDISPLLTTPIKFFDAQKLAAKKERYSQRLKGEVFARCYTLQQIELTRLTHFSKNELEELVAQFQQLEPQFECLGLNFDLFTRVMSNIFKWQYDEYFMKRLFTVLDNDQDFSVDFKELIFGVSVLCRGSVTQKMKLIFKVIDVNDDGLVDKEEMTKILQSIYAIKKPKQEAAEATKNGSAKVTNGRNWFNWEWDDPRKEEHNNASGGDNDSSSRPRSIQRTTSLNQRVLKMFGGSSDNSKANTPAPVALDTKSITVSDGSYPPAAMDELRSRRPMLLTRASSSREIITRGGKLVQQQPSTIATTKPKPKVDLSKEVAFFVDILFKAAEEYIRPPPPHLQPAILTRRGSMRIPMNYNPNCMNFDQFKEVILLQPMIVECFNLNASSSLREAPVSLIVK